MRVVAHDDVRVFVHDDVRVVAHDDVRVVGGPLSNLKTKCTK